MTDDMFNQLQPATIKDALGAKDETHKAAAKALDKHRADAAIQIPQARTRNTKLLVIDPSKLTGGELTVAADGQVIIGEDAVVGEIAIPEEFCGLDSTGCAATSDSRHMFSFTKEHGWWVHMSCGQPTRKWYTGAFLDLVETEDQELSFLDKEGE